MPAHRLAFLVLIALAWFAALAPVSAARHDPRMASIAGPKQKLVAGSAITLRVRVRRGANMRAFVATAPVTSRFGPSRGGVRSARLRVGKELERGLNHIGVRTRAGGRTDFDTVQVVVARRDRRFLTVRGAPRRRTARMPAVRASWRAIPHGLRARLNSKNVTREFLTGTGTTKAARLGPENGLRFGRNRLVVTAFSREGRFDREVRRFRVARRAPLVGTGADRTGAKGIPLKLDGRGSRAARGGRLRYFWRIVRRPRGSKVRLRDARSARPTLVPDVRGRYRLRLRVVERGSRRGRRGSAAQLEPLAAASAMDVIAPALPGPMGFPVSTIPAAGSGIQVAGTTYTTGTNWVQVMLFDRRTLEPRDVPHLSLPQANHPGTGQYAFNTGDAGALRSLFKSSASGIDASYLVVMTGGGRGIDIAKPHWQALTYAFGQLGGTMDPFANNGKGNSDPGFGQGEWSLIGVPGLTEGAAAQNWNLAPGANRTAGGIDGHLAGDSQKNYTFIAGDYPVFDTNLTGQSTDPRAGGTNVMEVDGVRYESTPVAPGESGFHVVILDAGTLALLTNQTFVTNTPSGQSAQAVQQMAATLNGATNKAQRFVVLVQSIGAPSPLNSAWTGPSSRRGTPSLASVIDELGGTADAFNSLAPAGGTKWGYALVGGTELSATEAAQNALNPENPGLVPPPAHLHGVLKRGDQYAYLPTTTASIDSPNFNGYDVTALELAFGPQTTAWPTHDTPAHQAAEDYIARRVFYPDLTPSQRGYDLHTYYWEADWISGTAASGYASALNQVCPPGGSVTAPPGSPFSSDELGFVCTQVQREFTWVAAVWGMTSAIHSSFLQQEINGPSNASAIAAQIANALNKQRSSDPESELLADFLLVEGTLLEAASEILFAAASSEDDSPDLAQAAGIGVLSGLFDMASDLANSPTGDPELASLDTQAKNIGYEIQARYQNAMNAAGKLAQMLVSDYGKLAVAGPKAQDPETWGFGQDRQTMLADSVQLSTTRFIWTQLLPGPFKVYNLGPGGSRWLQEGQGSWSPRTYRCYNNDNGVPGGLTMRPWRQAPAAGWQNQVVGIKKRKPYRQPNVMASSRFHFSGYGNQNHAVQGYAGAPVPGSIVAPLFKPVIYDQFSDPNAKVLVQVGLNKPEFFSESQGILDRVNVRC